ncbi:MAG: hypothetical protein ABL953_08135 [Ilumatobacteraceae bacterium]
MGRRHLQEQDALLTDAITDATEDHLRYALDGTIGDTQSFCWAALRQYDRKFGLHVARTPKGFGLQHADLHLLLVVAHEAVSHTELVERLLGQLGETQSLPPDPVLRLRLREARNLLAEHRDQRVLYRRLTARHTPHVIDTYSRLGIQLPDGSIDSEILGYFPPPGATMVEVTEGHASVGLVGGMLSLPELHAALFALERDLEELATKHRARGVPPKGSTS